MNQRNILEKKRERWFQRQSSERNKAEKKRLEDAKAAWKSLGAEKNGNYKQMCILSELVETRGKELRQAYENVVGVAYGYRTQKGRLKQVPSITFTVTEKYPDDSKKLTEKNRIPDFLFTYCTVQRKYRLCAIPTDVKDISVYKVIKPQSGSKFIIVEPPNPTKAARGTLTCVVRIENPNRKLDTQLYVMSCLHVLGMAQEFYPNFGSHNKVFLENGKRFIGKLSKHCGYIRDKTLHSFDAALAEVDEESALKDAMPKPRPSEILREKEINKIPDDYDIWTSSNGIIPARKDLVWEGTDIAIPYEDSSGLENLTIWHRIIISSFANTAPGDSGSPVVTKDGETLLGMHIAGGGGMAFMIPAFELFNAGNYYGLDTKSKLKMTSNY